MDVQTVNEGGLALGAIVTMTGAVVGTTRLEDGRVTYLVQYERKGEVVQDWFSNGDLVDMGFDDN